jgi:hypothetical protein
LLNETKVCDKINYIPVSFVAGNEASVTRIGLSTIQFGKINRRA